MKKETLKGHRNKVLSVAWNKNGRRLASGSADKTVRIYNTDKDLSISSLRYDAELKGHTGEISQLCWDPLHPDRLATVSSDRTLRLWDIRGSFPYLTRAPKNATHVIDTDGENINIAWNPSGYEIAVGNRNDIISFVDLRGLDRGEKPFISSTLKSDVEINEMTFELSGKRLYLTCGTGSIRIIDYPSLNQIHEVSGHTANCYCIDMDPTGKCFAVGGADAVVSIWDIKELICFKTYSGMDWPIRAISFNHDGTLLACGSEDLSIDICNVYSGEKVHSIPVTAAANSLCWNPNSNLLAFATDSLDKYNRPDGNLSVCYVG